MPGPWCALLLLAACLAASDMTAGSVEQYPISQLGGSCNAKLYTEDPLLDVDQLPLNTTVGKARTVALHLAVESTDWLPVRAPWIVSLVNPGYLDAADHPGFKLATSVNQGCAAIDPSHILSITSTTVLSLFSWLLEREPDSPCWGLALCRTVSLMTTSPDQQLLPHGGNQVEMQVAVNVSAAYSLPYLVTLDGEACTIELVDEVGLLQDQVTNPSPHHLDMTGFQAAINDSCSCPVWDLSQLSI